MIMILREGFGLFADACALLAAWFSLQTWLVVVVQKRRKRRKLEDYLKKEHPGQRDAGDQGARSMIHLMDELHMSESELLQAAFDSDHIDTVRSNKDEGIAKHLLLKYV